MRVLVTGATGFVGRWLIEELRAAGHEAVAAPSSSELSVTDSGNMRRLVDQVEPDAIAHLAGVSYAGDAARDPSQALEVNAGGTRAVVEAAAAVGRRRAVAVLVSGSSEVYGVPDPEQLPLREGAPLLATKAYGRSKVAQETAAIEASRAHGVPVIVTRSFNHTGPGQRTEFVAPALTSRLLQARRQGQREIRVGNLDVRRDLGDVRDVVRAYRLLLESLDDGSIKSGTVVNVATGSEISIRQVFELLAAVIGVDAVAQLDPELVREDDPPVIVGDYSKLRRMTGWEPRIPIETTLADLVADLERRGG